MKKFISLLLCALMVFSLAACSSNTPVNDSSSSSEPSSELQFSYVPELPSEPESSEPESSEPEAETSKILVVYFSATGSTKRVAESIAGAVGADLFELTPAEPYTDEDLDWTVSGSRVNLEHDDESLRDITLTSTEVPNWDSYETVFIGYPIWWGIAAWPVDSFVKANDFTGKTVIPFATSLV